MLSLNQMRLVGKLFGASVNDVLLAVCWGALRAYLQKRQALPDTPLLAGIPVSLHDPDDRSYSNKVDMLRATLATDLEDPLACLEAITDSTRAGKKLLHEARSLMPEDAVSARRAYVDAPSAIQ